jgi:hypothetical protein
VPADGRYDPLLTLGLINALTFNVDEKRLGLYGDRYTMPTQHPDQVAYELLKRHTGQDLPLDKNAWLNWYATLPAEKKESLPIAEVPVLPTPDDLPPDSYEVLPPREWRKRFGALRRRLESNTLKELTAVKKEILAIHDPQARGVINQLLARERDSRIRPFWVLALGGLPGDDSLETLVDLAVRDDEVAWQACMGLARAKRRDKVLELLAHKLWSKEHQAQAVQVICSTGLIEPLAAEQAPDRVLVLGLIDALALKSTEYYKQRRYYFFYASYFIPHPASHGYEAGYHAESGPVDTQIPVEVRTPNDLAHELLQQYTGQDFAMDQQAWTQWYYDTRRDRRAK